jgi:hypothetical protein
MPNDERATVNTSCDAGNHTGARLEDQTQEVLAQVDPDVPGVLVVEVIPQQKAPRKWRRAAIEAAMFEAGGVTGIRRGCPHRAILMPEQLIDRVDSLLAEPGQDVRVGVHRHVSPAMTPTTDTNALGHRQTEMNTGTHRPVGGWNGSQPRPVRPSGGRRRPRHGDPGVQITFY